MSGDGQSRSVWVGSRGSNGAETMATARQEVELLEGRVKDESLKCSLISPRMKAKVGAERTMS